MDSKAWDEQKERYIPLPPKLIKYNNMEKEKKDSTALDNIEKVMIGFFYLLGIVLFFASGATFHLSLMCFGLCFSLLAFALGHDYCEEEEEE